MNVRPGRVDHLFARRSIIPLRAALLTLGLIGAAAWIQAKAEPPEQVQPSAGTVADVRSTASRAAGTFGEYLDRRHDWLYRRMEYVIWDFDTWFAEGGVTAIVVPMSPLRIDFAGELLHNRNGFAGISAHSFDASVRVPNLEHRLKVFVTNDDLKEAPAEPRADAESSPAWPAFRARFTS